MLHIRRSLQIGLAALLFLLAGSAQAGGGGPTLITGVGASHDSRSLQVSRALGELLYQGRPSQVPHAGYIRIYPIFYGIPGTPARLYPASGTLCFDPPPVTSCRTLPAKAQEALAMLRALSLRTQPPTRVRAIYHGNRILRLPNLATAIELALERTGRPARAASATTSLRLIWRGPQTAARPAEIRIGEQGLYSHGHLYPLSTSIIRYLHANLS